MNARPTSAWEAPGTATPWPSLGCLFMSYPHSFPVIFMWSTASQTLRTTFCSLREERKRVLQQVLSTTPAGGCHARVVLGRHLTCRPLRISLSRLDRDKENGGYRGRTENRGVTDDIVPGGLDLWPRPARIWVWYDVCGCRLAWNKCVIQWYRDRLLWGWEVPVDCCISFSHGIIKNITLRCLCRRGDRRVSAKCFHILSSRACTGFWHSFSECVA